MNILEIKNVYKKYKSKRKKDTLILKGIDLNIASNEFVGIMGPSGSGKTTLLNVASGIDRCDDGEINIENNDICKMDSDELALFRRKNIGMVFQDFNLLSSLTIRENIMVPLILEKKYDEMEEKVINKIAGRFGIDEIMDNYPYEVSGGQQQRTAICRAVINKPKIIFADEPTGNLDSKASEIVLSYFKLLHEKYDSSILMVTHDPFSASYCDRIVFLQDGLIVKEIKSQGDKAEFFNKIIESQQDFNKEKFKSDLAENFEDIR